MISKESAMKMNMLKVIVKGTWDRLPEILSAIPATVLAGKVLSEVRDIVEEARKANADSKELKDKIDKLVKENGGEEAFGKELSEELAQQCAENPKYINCAIFTVKSGEHLSEDEQEQLLGILTGEMESEDSQVSNFIRAFTEDYFSGDMDSCDNACEMDESYIAFNFDDSTDHEYLEEDLIFIRDSLNRIVGREVFDRYEGAGADVSVNYD